MERWKPVVGWEEVYEVSDLGRVRRVSGASGTQAGRILRPRLTAAGYEQVSLCKSSKPKNFAVHRLVAAAFIGPPPAGKYEINHLDGGRRNNAPTNLEYTDRSGNNLHSFRVLKRAPVAFHREQHHNAKLTHKAAAEIRTLYDKGGITQKQLAGQFSVSPALINFVINGRAWD